MARDPVGASAVNMTANAKRQDVYTEVALAANAIIDRDAAAGVAEALAWKGKVSRSTVKRAVMTTPYGVTPRGMRDQFISDGHTQALKTDSHGAAADYLRDVVVEAIGSTVSSARQVMGYLQGCALALAQENVPFDWTLPDGAQVRQAYWKRAETRFTTMWGKPMLWKEVPSTGLSLRKQALAAAPQFVHSYDALHLRRTVLALAQIVEGPALSMIHDSYGTHAAYMDAMAGVLRSEFVRIYERDVLAELDATLRAAHPNIEFPDLPERGIFDVREVLRAPFFFS
jgi:DNA-directed RNA polymerase